MQSKGKLFFIFCVTFLLAIFIHSIFLVDVVIPLIVLVILLALFTGLLIFFNNKPFLRIYVLVGMVFVFGLARYSLAIIPQEDIRVFNDEEKVRFVGYITEEPDLRTDHMKLTVEVEQLKHPKEISLSGRVLVNSRLYPRYSLGDQISVSCSLNNPSPIDGFAYDKYLARLGIHSICNQANIKLVTEKYRQGVFGLLFKGKERIVLAINRTLPEPHSSLLNGLLLGAKRGLPDDLKEVFQRTGLMHIVVVSGYNITIIASIFQIIFLGIGLSRKKSFWLASAGIFSFVILTGGEASVVRAGVMGFMLLLAHRVGRVRSMKNGLAGTAALMVLLNPLILLHDVGFQLSFLATIGLVYLAPMIDYDVKRIIKWTMIREILVATTSAILITTPLVLLNFGQISLVAPIVNLPVLLLTPATMAAGAFTVIADLIFPSLGKIIGWFSWFLLNSIIYFAEQFSNLPFAAKQVQPVWGALIATVVLLALFLLLRRRQKSLTNTIGG